MTKYIKLDDAEKIMYSTGEWDDAIRGIETLPTTTIPEPYKGTNWDLLQEYINEIQFNVGSRPLYKIKEMLEEIQSRLVNDIPKIGEEYEFSNNGSDWKSGTFVGFGTEDADWDFIRPISPIPPEISSAIKLLEDSNYIVTKK